MTPIVFQCRATISGKPAAIAERLLDLTRWPEFRGYGPLPGVKVAAFETRTADVVGSRIRVANDDGSSHVEEITVWQPERLLQLRLQEFSPPLCRFADQFVETWELQGDGPGTHVTRRFELHVKSRAAKPVVWLIGCLLKRAVARHMRQLGRE
ncbi:MAG: SRPBCC family protein [Planctomycetales bacterium]|nr:SRPBCC family protein [Planctomycetales bacterium]